MSGGTDANNRVTTQQFYETQLETNKEIAATNDKIAQMEIRILERLDGIPTRVGKNEDEIKTLRKRSNLNDVVVLVVGVVVSAITSAIGWNR